MKKILFGLLLIVVLTGCQNAGAAISQPRTNVQPSSSILLNAQECRGDSTCEMKNAEVSGNVNTMNVVAAQGVTAATVTAQNVQSSTSNLGNVQANALDAQQVNAQAISSPSARLGNVQANALAVQRVDAQDISSHFASISNVKAQTISTTEGVVTMNGAELKVQNTTPSSPVTFSVNRAPGFSGPFYISLGKADRAEIQGDVFKGNFFYGSSAGINHLSVRDYLSARIIQSHFLIENSTDGPHSSDPGPYSYACVGSGGTLFRSTRPCV